MEKNKPAKPPKTPQEKKDFTQIALDVVKSVTEQKQPNGAEKTESSD